MSNGREEEVKFSSVVNGKVEGEEGDVSKSEHLEDELGVLCKKKERLKVRWETGMKGARGRGNEPGLQVLMVSRARLARALHEFIARSCGSSSPS